MSIGKRHIEWAGESWNPITGCRGPSLSLMNFLSLTYSPTSREICPGCYAEATAKRFAGRFGYPKDDPFKPTFHADKEEIPLSRRKPTVWFLCSMGEWLADEVKKAWLLSIADVIKRTPWHLYISLTKQYDNLERILEVFPEGIPRNLWIGVSVNYEYQLYGLDRLRQFKVSPAWKGIIPNFHPFLAFCSFEPMMEEGLKYTDLSGLDWIIVGGRSAHGKYPKFTPPKEWVTTLIACAKEEKIPVFVKPNIPSSYSRLMEMPAAYYEWKRSAGIREEK